MIVSLGMIVRGTVSPALAVGCGQIHCYGGQGSSTTFVRGVDGYIWATAVVLDDPLRNFQAHFVNLCPQSACNTGWAQIGPFQGSINADRVTAVCPISTCVRSQTAIHMYGENTDGCTNYTITDFGAPPAQNTAYYLSYSGISQFFDCKTQYKYYFRHGSISNPPDGSAWLGAISGVPIAESEVINGEAIATDYFGLDGSHGINDGFGLHVLQGATWNIWNAASVPGTSTLQYQPPYYVGKKAYSAFQTHG